MWAKNNERKTDSGQNRLDKGVEVAAKCITKKCILGKIQLKKTASRAKYNGERRRGFGKIHYEKMHCEQNAMKEKRILGQNTMEKGVEVSAKYVTKKCISGKIK